MVYILSVYCIRVYDTINDCVFTYVHAQFNINFTSVPHQRCLLPICISVIRTPVYPNTRKVCSDGDPSSSELPMDDKSVESMLTGKHQGVRSYYQLFQQVKSRRVELSTNVNTLLTTLLELDNVRDIRSAPVVNAFHKFKEILESLQAAQDEASRDLYILYFHPTAAGETLYKQLKSTTALQKLGVGDDMLEHKGTSELLDTAVKAVEKAKREKEKLKNEKDKKDAKVPGGRGHQPSTQWKNHRGGGRGRGGVGRGDGWASAHTFQAPPHTGWHGGGGGYSLHAPGPSPYYNGGQFPPQSGRGGGPPGGRP